MKKKISQILIPIEIPFRIFGCLSKPTELMSFGPYAMAGDAFSVSDELTSLFCSSESGFSSESPATGMGRLELTRLLITLSSSGSFENRCAYVKTIESFSTELSDGRIHRSMFKIRILGH